MRWQEPYGHQMLLTADSQPMVTMLDPANITNQLNDIRARFAVLENAGTNRYNPAQNPAIYSPVRPSAPIVSPLPPRRE